MNQKTARKHTMSDGIQEWHYARGGKQLGPVTSEALKQLAGNNELSPEDLIWKEGWTEWKRADRIKNLFPMHSSKNKPPILPNSQPEQVRAAVEAASQVNQKLWFLDLKFQQFATPRLIGFLFAAALAGLIVSTIGVAVYTILNQPIFKAGFILFGAVIILVFEAICLRVFLECCLLGFRAVEHLSYLQYLEKEE
jgi:hypothetical protein